MILKVYTKSYGIFLQLLEMLISLPSWCIINATLSLANKKVFCTYKLLYKKPAFP